MKATAIVTGSGRGIGKETAIILAKNGLNVVVCSRTRNEIDSTVDEVSQINPNVLGIKCDTSSSSQVQNLVNKTLQKFGGISVLVNNAGVAVVKKLIATSEKEWDRTIDINLKGAFLCSKAVLPHMMKGKDGTIVNVSSGAGKVGFENLSAYCASKFGMIGLTESLAWEVAEYNIRVMSICPGEVATRMQEDSDLEYHGKNYGGMLKPEQVAAKVAEMILDKRSYVNGQSVDI